jgi:hypothetical protein
MSAVRACVGVLLCGIALAAASFAAMGNEKQPATPEDRPAAAATQPAEDAADVSAVGKRWAAFATPGEPHRRLDPLIGRWNYKLNWWPAPGGDPLSFTGRAEYRWILDGRFLQQEILPGPPGSGTEDHHGLAQIGHNNMTSEYQAVWIDNSGTGMMIGRGQWDAAAKALTLHGQVASPLTGQKDRKWRSVTRIESRDKHTYTFYAQGAEGKEYKEMETVFTRAEELEKDQPRERR